MRLAGTWKQYSKKAMPQLIKMTTHSFSNLNLRWPYQAAVMNRLEQTSRPIVAKAGGILGMRVLRAEDLPSRRFISAPSGHVAEALRVAGGVVGHGFQAGVLGHLG